MPQSMTGGTPRSLSYEDQYVLSCWCAEPCLRVRTCVKFCSFLNIENIPPIQFFVLSDFKVPHLIQEAPEGTWIPLPLLKCKPYLGHPVSHAGVNLGRTVLRTRCSLTPKVPRARNKKQEKNMMSHMLNTFNDFLSPEEKLP